MSVVVVVVVCVRVCVEEGAVGLGFSLIAFPRHTSQPQAPYPAGGSRAGPRRRHAAGHAVPPVDGPAGGAPLCRLNCNAGIPPGVWLQ